MANDLFPVFDVPEIKLNTTAEEQKYRRSAYFDFELGDFLRTENNNIAEASGKEAYIQWCIKAIKTERLSKLCYSHNIGSETENIWNLSNKQAIESTLKSTITDTLMVNNMTSFVSSFKFEWKNDCNLEVYFTVKGKNWEEFNLSLKVR